MTVQTSDLTASCLKAVQLRREGKVVGSATGALYRGLLFGEACAQLHKHPGEGHSMIVAVSTAAVERQLDPENRPLTPAVVKGKPGYFDEVLEALGYYEKRVMPRYKKVIGLEVPVRIEALGFASHVDLLGRLDDGRLVIADWKWREDDPSPHYLARNLQLASYYLAGMKGAFKIDELGDWWEPGEWPVVDWVHAPALFPYKRRTEGVDDNGEVVVYQKGDERPIDKIIRTVPFTPESEPEIVGEITLRTQMIQMGMFPKNPDPLGCRLCESNQWCVGYTRGGRT